MSNEITVSSAQTRRHRTRSGCLNCRRKRKKCDEKRPICHRCARNSEHCQWDNPIRFRPPTGLTSAKNSMRIRPALLQVESESEGAFENPVVQTDAIQATQHHISNEASMHDTPDLQRQTPATISSETDKTLPGPSVIDEDYTQTDFAVDTESGHILNTRDSCSLANPSDVDNGLLRNDLVSPSLDCERCSEDGVFGPGSAYQNLFLSLRSQIFQTVLFEYDEAYPNTSSDQNGHTSAQQHCDPNNIPSMQDPSDAHTNGESVEVPTLELQPPQEHLLWKAWTEEVSTWLDKFDPQTHFRDYFSALAKQRPHLKYAILSLSARYLESRDGGVPPSLTLALYQHTIHLLLPQMCMRDTAVIASCVLLCVLEMFSCSPKAWRRHLEGCASLLQSLNIRGDNGGPEEAVFWCFARMDLCGGLISLEPTLIPVAKWTSDAFPAVSISTYPCTNGFQDYAKMASNFVAQAMELFAANHASQGTFGFCIADPLESEDYAIRWRRLFGSIQEWLETCPREMSPVMEVAANDYKSPFPAVLYSNAAAISGNQFVHTAAILMLQRKPVDFALGKSRSMLWHARQICGIAISNNHHGAWTNSVQPIWIAGRLMSHPREHDAIICLLQRIEKETGWATKWRVDDLREYWGIEND